MRGGGKFLANSGIEGAEWVFRGFLVAEDAEVAADSDCRRSPRLTWLQQARGFHSCGATIGNRPRFRCLGGPSLRDGLCEANII